MNTNVRKVRKLEDEEWREVPNSDGLYLVSSYGRVKSFVVKKEKGYMMRPALIKNFKYVHLKINKTDTMFFIHKLVATVWLPKPSDKHAIVTHLDRNLKNNHYSNLQWVTPKRSWKTKWGIFQKNVYWSKASRRETQYQA